MFVVVGDLLATEVAHGSAAGAVHQVAALRLEESEEIIVRSGIYTLAKKKRVIKHMLKYLYEA